MEIKRFHTITSPSGEVLDRETLLNSPQARGIIAELEAMQIASGKPKQVITAQEIFKAMIERGTIRELEVQSIVEVDRLTDTQVFSPNVIAGGIAEGWLDASDKTITIHTTDGDLVYNIVKKPGRYCCHCGEKLQDDATGETAREHVAKKHAGKQSPDPENPSGYKMQNFTECEVI